MYTETIFWHEVAYHEATEEEKNFYNNGFELVFDCVIPDDGQEVLVKTNCGVSSDFFVITKHESYFGLHRWDNVIAWAEMPTGEKESV